MSERPELSKKNKWWIERHRYYELKHFCMQYTVWKRRRAELQSSGIATAGDIPVQSSEVSDPTARAVELMEICSKNIGMIEKASASTDLIIGPYILKGVTNGWSYDILRFRTDIPCCKEVYYDFYRKFFWILDKLRK